MPGKPSVVARFLNDDEKRDLLLRMRYGNVYHGHRSISPDLLRVDGRAVSALKSPLPERTSPRSPRNQSERPNKHNTTPEGIHPIRSRTHDLFSRDPESCASSRNYLPFRRNTFSSNRQEKRRECGEDIAPANSAGDKFDRRLGSPEGAGDLFDSKFYDKAKRSDETNVMKIDEELRGRLGKNRRNWERKEIICDDEVVPVGKTPSSRKLHRRLHRRRRRRSGSEGATSCLEELQRLDVREKSRIDKIANECSVRNQHDNPSDSVVKIFYEMPASKPKNVCFDYPGVRLTYYDVMEAIERVVPSAFSQNNVVSIQFENINVKLGTSDHCNRWHIQLADVVTRNKLIKAGLVFLPKRRSKDTKRESFHKSDPSYSCGPTGKQHVPILLYDQVVFEEYKLFLKKIDAEEKLQSVVLQCAGRGQNLLSTLI